MVKHEGDITRRGSRMPVLFVGHGMTNFPFYLGGTYHWGIRGLDERWECDDFPTGFSHTTRHQVWTR